jgi:hypothetical protein
MGHPDGQNYALWRGPDFFASQAAHVDSTHPIVAQGLITNFASVIINVLAPFTPGVTVKVQFFTDATMTIQTWNFTWGVAPGRFLDMTVPAQGNFVKVTVTTTDPVGYSITIAIIPSNNIVPRVVYGDQNNATGNLLFSVGISATTVFPLPNLVAGKGWVYCQDVTSSGKISYAVATIDVNGAVVNNIIAVANPLIIDFHEFTAPDLCLALRVTNNDGVAAHNASAYINVIDR